MAKYYIYRTTRQESEAVWGERQDREAAKSYADTVFALYRPGGDLEREDDPLLKVAVVDTQSGQTVYEREVERK